MAEETKAFDYDERVADYIKCQSCGANMVFDPNTQMLVCVHCGNKVAFQADTAVREIAIEKALSVANEWSDTLVLKCANCGAMVTIDREEVALECPYCGTSHIRRTEEIAGVKPNALYPFTLDQQSAETCARKWAKSLIFAPSKFKKNLTAKNLHGVYQPCFTFDSQTVTVYDGRLGERRTRTVRTKNGTRTETYIAWFHVKGVIDVPFNDVTISASNNIPQKKIDKIMPFDYNTICVYEKKFLAGFLANHYDKDVRTSWGEAKVIMTDCIKREIKNKYNADVVDYINTSVRHENVTYKYVLLPIYVLNYTYKKKTYEITINGNTGKVSGNSPLSFWRVLVAFLIFGGLFALLYVLFSNGETSSASVLEYLENLQFLL